MTRRPFRLVLVATCVAIVALLAVQTFGVRRPGDAAGVAPEVGRPAKGESAVVPSTSQQAAPVGSSTRVESPTQPPNPPVPQSSPFDRAGMAAGFGVEDHGLLDSVGRERVTATLQRALDGAMKELKDAAAREDSAQSALVMQNMLKYQAALVQLGKDEYLTTEPVVFPKAVPKGYDPTILFNAAVVGGKTVGVLFPIRIDPGSELDLARQLTKEMDAAALDRVVVEFNAQDLPTRRSRIEEMKRAQSEVSRATSARFRGELSETQFREATEPWLDKQPPRGTALDMQDWLLRRL